MDVFSRLYALSPDGGLKWIVRNAGYKGVDVGADGTVYATYTALGAYTPSGSVKWSFKGEINNTATAPDAGPDGVVYFVHNLGTLYAVNPNGTQRWKVVTTEIMEEPIVHPMNGMVVMGGLPNYGMSGFFKAISTTSSNELWRVTLAPENGGNLVPDSRPRFAPNGQTLYMTAQILGGDYSNEYGYVYAIDTTGTVPPTPTPGPTSTPTNTPVPPTPTGTPAPGGSAGFLSPSVSAALTVRAGDNNGYQTNPANAYADDSAFAIDSDSGKNTNTSCSNGGKDKHIFTNYNFNIPATAALQGIQVRLDAHTDAISGSPKLCVELSWDGGATWTTTKTTPALSTTEATYLLGGQSDTWGRTWTPGNFSNANFRLRISNVASNINRDFFLDYVAVNVTYQP